MSTCIELLHLEYVGCAGLGPGEPGIKPGRQSLPVRAGGARVAGGHAVAGEAPVLAPAEHVRQPVCSAEGKYVLVDKKKMTCCGSENGTVLPENGVDGGV